ncbi:MAG: hypothetical protein NVSMB42_03190 [Herpetosiphon sp.]
MNGRNNGTRSNHAGGNHTSNGASWLWTVLALGRIALGAYWLWEQHWKLPPRFGIDQPRGLMFAFQQGIQYPTSHLYQTFLQQIVVPHFFLFGWIAFMTEIAIGTSLTLGLLTRLGALAGSLQAINLLLAEGKTPEGPWIYIAIVAANLLILLSPSHRRLSLDSRIGQAAELGNPLARLAQRFL